MPTINNFTFNEPPIGEGGMGCVYKATNQYGEPVALKMLRTEYASMPAFRKFFDIEASALSSLDHPDVVRIKGVPFSDTMGNLYLPMEFVEGITIEKRIKDLAEHGGKMPEAEAIDIMAKVLDAFSYIHANGKIHRDIKPSNIMLRPGGQICVIDFGIAKDNRLPSGLTIGNVVGTDGYMSPEQVDGLNIDHRTDIYSLGCLLYYMMTGSHAITPRSNDYETKCTILKSEFPNPRKLRPDISRHLEEVIMRATDKDMRKRPQNAVELKKELLCGTSVMGGNVTVGRADSNDIVVPQMCVSGSHLDISYNESKAGPVITVIDHSSNGTAIDGRFIKHNSISVPFNLISQSVSTLPEVLLSGREDCMLDWNEVLLRLRQQVNVHSAPGGPDGFGGYVTGGGPGPTPDPKPIKRFNFLWIVIAVLVLIIILLLV